MTLFERGLSPSLLAVHALGRAPLATTPPRAHVLEALLLAVPSTTLALTLLAPAALLAKRARLPAPFLFAAAFVLVPVVLPRSVASFPAPWCLAVPFVAICSAHGARFVASVTWNPRRPLSHAPVETVVAALALLEPVVSSVDLPTAPAAVPWLVSVPGPASRVAPFDGSLLGAVGSSFRRAPGIGLTRVWAPEIATEVWEGSVRWRRLPRGVVRAEREADADYLLLAGRRSPPPGFEVVRTLRRGTRTVAVLYRRLLSRPAA